MGKKTISISDAVPPLPVFSQAVVSGGNVYVSGNVGCTHDLKLVEGGVQAQTVCHFTQTSEVRSLFTQNSVQR